MYDMDVLASYNVHVHVHFFVHTHMYLAAK